MTYGTRGAVDKVALRTPIRGTDMAKPKETEEMDNAIPQNNPEVSDSTQGFGVDPTNVRVEDSAASADKPKGVKVDPVTNQPMSDFMPNLPEDHPDAAAVAVANDRIKVGSAMGRVGAAQNLVDAREANRQRMETNKESKDTTFENNPLPEQEFAMLPPDVYRARMQARVMAEAATLGTSTSVPGGRFKVGDRFVNANGEPVE